MTDDLRLSVVGKHVRSNLSYIIDDRRAFRFAGYAIVPAETF